MEVEWIGSEIKFHRIKKGLTVKQLADLSSVDESSISHAENGTKQLSYEKIIQIFNALEINFSDCLNSNSEKNFIAHNIKMELKDNHFTETELDFINTLLNIIGLSKEDTNDEYNEYIRQQNKVLPQKE